MRETLKNGRKMVMGGPHFSRRVKGLVGEPWNDPWGLGRWGFFSVGPFGRGGGRKEKMGEN